MSLGKEDNIGASQILSEFKIRVCLGKMFVAVTLVRNQRSGNDLWSQWASSRALNTELEGCYFKILEAGLDLQ